MTFFCPICGKRGELDGYARVAPFVVELASLPPMTETALVGCPQCGLRYFGYRFGVPTMDARYSGYRGTAYLQARKRWEPWYSRAVPSKRHPEQQAIVDRTSFMWNVMGSEFELSSLRNIVDFGGDSGQFLPVTFTGPKYVIEVSGKDLVPGVTAIPSIGEMDQGPPHLVVAAHLLEHLPEPTLVVREIRNAIDPDGWFYVEVPLDLPHVRAWHRADRYRRLLDFYGRHRLTWIVADFASGVFRNFGRTLPRLGVVKQSEHINYFSERSLTYFLEQEGFRVVRFIAEPNARLEGLRLGRLGVVAKPRL